MPRKALLTLLALAMMPGAGLAQPQAGERLRAWLAARQTEARAVPPAPGKQALAYGTDPAQALDYWPAQDGNRKAPLVVFVHGGGWKRGSKDNASGPWKAPHFTGEGYAYASLNYRLVPGASVEQQGADVATALAFLISHAKKMGFDPGRVVIMGHSAGAHLVALVGTDERYLRGAGLSFASIRGVIPIDGAAYDVPRQIAGGGNFMHDTYLQAFGTDPARQKALSPTLQAVAPNAPAFLLIHVQRPDGVEQNKMLETALKAAGTPVERRDFPGTGLIGHMDINRSLGDPAYPATGVVDAWLKRVFAR